MKATDPSSTQARGLGWRRRTGGSSRIGAGAGGQDGVNGIHGVFNVWFVADGGPSLQRHLAVIAGLASVDDDRIVVRCVCRLFTIQGVVAA
jgi:hypothetical protein